MKRNCVAVVSLNPSLDRTVWIDRFLYGGTNRVNRVQEDVAGKGTNVCMAFAALGQPCVCVGFDYRDSAVTVAETLAKKGVERIMTVLPGTMRTNLKLFEESTGVMTEVNERGAEIAPDALAELLQKYRDVLEQLDEHSIVVLSGSVPPGVPADIYGQMIHMAKEHGIRTLLDASGEPLLRGMEALPFAAKPNEDEIALVTGRPVKTREQAVLAAKELTACGVQACCVSLGAEGAVYATPETAYQAFALQVPVRGIQGAGDSLVAGMCMALMQERPAQDALRYAMAAAGGSVSRDGSLMCTRELFEELLPTVAAEECF